MEEEGPKPGSIVHVELPCKDTERAKKFYSGIFGWKFEDIPEMNYSMFQPANPPGGGIFVPTEFNPGGALNYILVESVEQTSKRIEEAGGKILVPEREIPNMGSFAVFEDPEGTTMALWTPTPRQQE